MDHLRRLSAVPHKRKIRTSRDRSGFTLTELMVVIAIIVVLIALLIPGLKAAWESANRVNCMSNLRVLSAACLAYAADQDGSLVSSLTDDNGWVKAGNTEDAIRQGTLFPFVKDTRVYHCPDDANGLHLRSYSINAQLNGDEPWFIAHPAWTRLSQVKHAASTYLILEELDPAHDFDLNGFIVIPTGDLWLDIPANFHVDGNCVSFCDGHVEYWKYTDPRTTQLTAEGTTQPGNADLHLLQSWVGL